MVLSVVIPAHNEEDHIEGTVRALVATLDREQVLHEIVVVDDHSSDGTGAVLARLVRELPTLRPVENHGAGGYGYAVRAGLDAYRGDAVCIVMADASDDPADVVRYYRELEKGYDCAFGSRFIAGARASHYPPHKLVLNRLVNWLIRLLFGLPYNDVTNAFKCFRRETIDGIRPLLSCHFNLTVELPLKAIVRGYSYSVVPTQWYGRAHGESKLKLKEMGSRYLFIILYVLLERWLSRGDYRSRHQAHTPTQAPAPTTVPTPAYPDPDAAMSGRERRWLGAVAAVMLAIAFARGVAVTHDLDWPNDPDLYRDIAQAQTILDGSFLDDPHYLGETIWYSPLVPSIVAALQWTTGGTLHVLETRAGAYLNLLGPIAFYLLVVTLFGRWTAVVALAIFLFCSGDPGPSYASSTYSPWLFVANFVQAFYYATMIVLYRAVHSERLAHFAIVGVLLGLTFLGHTAPAVLLGGMVSLYAAVMALRSAGSNDWRGVWRALERFALVVALALLVSTPYVLSIAGHYHLKIVNQYPTFWIYPEMELSNLQAFLAERAARSIVPALLVGVVAFATTSAWPQARAGVVASTGLALAGVVYSYVWQYQLEHGSTWPSVVPGFHFLRYFSAGEAIIAAYGVAAMGSACAAFAARRAAAAWWPPVLRRAVPAALACVLVGVSYPAYASRIDLTGYRNQAQRMFSGPDFDDLFRWVRERLTPEDVVAAPENLALSLVGPAGRKVLAVERFFSNPYVDWQTRHINLDALYYGLDGGYCDSFKERADRFKVTHILAKAGSVQPAIVGACSLAARFTGREWVLYERVGSRPDPAKTP